MILEMDMLVPIIKDVIAGLDFLHQASPPILHCDIKAANILLDSSFSAKGELILRISSMRCAHFSQWHDPPPPPPLHSGSNSSCVPCSG